MTSSIKGWVLQLRITSRIFVYFKSYIEHYSTQCRIRYPDTLKPVLNTKNCSAQRFSTRLSMSEHRMKYCVPRLLANSFIILNAK